MSLYSGATVGWLALSAVLAGVVAFELSEDSHLAPTVTAEPIKTTATEPDDLALSSVVTPSLDLLNDIAERPLFSASRRPDELEVEEQLMAADTPSEKFSLELVGTMLSGTSRMVLLKHPNKGLLRLREGQVVDGWEIGKIDHNLVELKNGDEVERLKLRTDLLQPKRPGPKAQKPPRKSNEGEEKAVFAPVDGKGQTTVPLAKQ